jgi:ribonucleoside-diphosphate reductase alpha chain
MSVRRLVPFYKLFQSAVRSCSQGSIRNGSATLYYPIFHLEIEDMLVLKNNKGTEETRIRQMDYGVQFNKLFYERLITGGNITLFSPHDVPDMYEAFFNDYPKFKNLYETAERNTKIRKKTVKALDLFTSFIQERKDTGRIYLQNVDNANTHSSFIESNAPIRQSNLCSEITLHARPMGSRKISNKTVENADFPEFIANTAKNDTKILEVISKTENSTTYKIDEDNSRIALCTLSAINWGNIKTPSDFEKPCMLAVRALDALLDYQEYPVYAAYMSTMEHRPLGVGIINLAYWLAKNDLKYSDDSALVKLDEYAEAWSYYLIKASVDLAKEKGACLRVDEVKYGLGIMPIDTRKIDVDELVPHVERMPWAQLREDAKKYGIRNATLMALMPAETSAQVANATNGIEPPRAYVSIKQSKDGVLKQVVPEYRRLKNKYELLWDQKSPVGYLNICAILQKYIDQGISVNTSYNPKFYPDEKIPLSDLLSHVLMFYKRGGKQLYYNQTNDQAGEVDVDKMILNESIEELDEEDCDSCKI